MITLLIISAIFLIIIGVLFVPIRVVINTNKKQYYLQLPGYFRADLLIGPNQPFRIRLKVFFISFIIEPLKKKKKEAKPKTAKKPNKRKIKNPVLLLKNMLRKIKIKYCRAHIDTGDFPLNARLVPFAYALNRKKIDVTLNFQGENDLDMMLQTRGISLTTTYIKHVMLNR